MVERANRFAIAVLLTTMAAAILERCLGSLLRTWSHASCRNPALLGLPALWAKSAAVLWVHVYHDFRQTVKERESARSPASAPMAGELRRDGDV